MSGISETAEHMDRLVAGKIRRNNPLTNEELTFLARVGSTLAIMDRLIEGLSRLRIEGTEP